MKAKKYLFVALCLVCLIFQSLDSYSQTHEQVEKIPGSWTGTLKVQGMELRIVFNISFNQKDSLIVTLDSPDQGAKGIATSKTLLTKDSLIVKVRAIGGTYKGSFNKEFNLLKGEWKQGGMAFPLDLVQHEKPVELNRPQEPKPPFPYIEKEVVFKNSKAGIELAGTVTEPKEGGPFPVAVLVTGSGPQNRNEELMGHKPFLVLADYLTRHGIAVLRYDDRGVGKSGGKFSTATTRDFADDAIAAIHFLKNEPDIDTMKIGIIGHSEGGIVAPMVAAERNDIAFIVMMAGPGLTGEKIILMQTELISRANGMDEKEIAQTLKTDQKTFNILRKNPDDSEAAGKIRKLLLDLSKKEKKDTTGNSAAIEAQVKSITSPWFRYFLFFDPMTVLTKVHCPLLALNGEKDLQVPPKENLEAIEKAMIMGGNHQYTVVEIPGVNHLFQTSSTGDPSEYGKIEETIAPKALETISDWINRVCNQKRQD